MRRRRLKSVNQKVQGSFPDGQVGMIDKLKQASLTRVEGTLGQEDVPKGEQPRFLGLTEQRRENVEGSPLQVVTGARTQRG